MAKLNEVQWNKEQLWEGCILASIAHAIMVAHYPEISNEHSWDGINYNIQDSAGTRGTITFHPQGCVAAFRNDKSGRIISGDFYASEYFKGAPNDIVKLAESETLQYLLDKIDEKIVPVITTAFWEKDKKLFSHDSLIDMVGNGGAILERQLMDVDSAIKSWTDYYDMNEEQISLLKAIYTRKINSPNNILRLSKTEVKMIGCDDEEGLNESKISFEEMNILLEI